MSCKKCNTSPCFQGECGCTHKVDTECITYNGNSLACTNIPEGINLNDLIKSLDQSICNTIDLIGSMVIENVGDGAGTFYQIGNTGIREFRSLNSTNTNLSIVENVDQIDFTVPNSTDSQRGAIELATEAESNALIDTERAVTPATLPIASETQQGLAEIATQAEVDAGVDDQRYITPLKQGVYVNNTATTIVTNYVADPTNLPSASTTQEGVIEIATQAEVDAGVATNLAVVPSTLETYTTTYVNNYVSNPVNLPNATETQRGIAELATTTEVQTGTDVERIVTPAGLSSRIATETRTGILEVATQAEANALSLDNKIVTPAKLPIASTTQQGIVETATQAEVDAGTDTIRYVTPSTLEGRLSSLGTILRSTTITVSSWTKDTFTSGLFHNIGISPIAVIVNLRNTISEGGYTPGGVTQCQTGGRDQDGNNDYDYGIGIEFSGTNTYNLMIGDRVYLRRNDGVAINNVFQPTEANWDIEIVFLHI